jgi:hypothetical protein
MEDFFNFDDIGFNQDTLDKNNNIDIGTDIVEKQKLDIFKTLNAIDHKQGNFLNMITEQEKKSFVPLVVMQWMTGLSDKNPNTETNLRLVNELVNMNFWELYKHPELQYKLMTLCGDGKSYRRAWIPMASKESKHFIIRFMYDRMPSASDKEIELLVKKMTFDDINDMLMSYAVDKDTQEKVIDSYAKLTGQLLPKKTRKKSGKSQ